MGAACSTEGRDEAEAAQAAAGKGREGREGRGAPREAHTVRHWHEKMMMSAASQAVFEAAQRGDSRKVHTALKAHGDPNCVNFAGYNALMLSVAGGYIEAFSCFSGNEASADPNRGISGVAPLMIARHFLGVSNADQLWCCSDRSLRSDGQDCSSSGSRARPCRDRPFAGPGRRFCGYW
ncbi:unnamed protein product [Durusdinium trenchii]|uniref:Uncharacterized protein n=1 Tax=Durusdinium trenchii TaxID=1381693 RepID=A0ABP0KJ69_9DINO